ncbi:hypothetical protein H1230_30200 [Paenibacillus sp. 19GGS1-52]|uniref:hypothetical protein n=1 Tax=Paenibacillus sp. 19GGS1-52 TaxID=2758563 RepID=UPI001EFBAA51|nr:hypothetical protein [Paenibacillus sp. 19GGS1-52]ULO07161.1 hypothetical protein H1230_30200 [Paenibacillus sp. 19GGS1-52]
MKNFQVTELNISSVPVDWLYARYQRLQKGSKNKPSPALLQELEIIKRYLDKSGKSTCNEFQSPEVEQIELNIPIAIRQQYVSIVEYRLKEYYQLTKRKKWLEIEVRQLRPHEPKVTAAYDPTGVSARSGFAKSSTEQAVMNMFEKADKLEDELWEVEGQMYPVERALRSLNYEQLMLIESKYFCREEALDDYLMIKFNWYRAKYYSVKKTALILLAQSLRIV